VKISATGDGLSHTVSATVAVTPVLTGTVAVDLSSAFNVTGIYKDGSKFSESASLDDGGYSLSEEQVGSEQIGEGVVFKLGPASAPDVVTGKTVTLPAGKFTSLKILASAVEGNQEQQTFSVNYADGTSSSFTRSLSDWAAPGNLEGESSAGDMAYRLASDGSKDTNTFHLHAYSFALDANKTVRSVTLPSNRNVLALGMTLVPANP
jgi:hypothetical protein